jgi:hypothetical protein
MSLSELELDSLTVHLTPARQSQWHRLEAPGVGSTFIKLDRRGAKELLSQTASLSQLASPGAQAARFCLSDRLHTPANCKHIVHRLGASLSEQLKLSERRCIFLSNSSRLNSFNRAPKHCV